MSPDQKHDSFAVAAFTDVCYEHLKTKRNLKFVQDFQFTDGCGVQYKSKCPFEDVSKSKIKITRSFFGNRHGKGPSDGATGVVKSMCRSAVKSRRTQISNAEEMFKYCAENLTKDSVSSHSNESCDHKKRSFLYVAQINRDRTHSGKTLKGTKKVHCVETCSLLKLKTRNLSCFCQGCLTENECEKNPYVDEWVDASLCTNKTTHSKKKVVSDEKIPDIIRATQSYKRKRTESSQCNKSKKSKGNEEVINLREEKRKSESLSRCRSNRNNGTDIISPTRVLRSNSVVKENISTNQLKRADKPCTKEKLRSINQPKKADKSVTKEKIRLTNQSKKSGKPFTKENRRSINQSNIADKPVVKDNIRSKIFDKSELTVKNKIKSTNQSNLKDKSPIREEERSTMSKQPVVKGKQIEKQGEPGNNEHYNRNSNFTTENSVQLTIMGLNKSIDKNSMQLKPVDIGGDLYPVNVYGDGNCLPRCGSLVIYGTEEKHKEVRERIVNELTQNRQYYLNQENMRNGRGIDSNPDVIYTFAMYSPDLQDNEKLDKKTIEAVYDREVLRCEKNAEYMGIWQIAALCNVLNRRIFSVYPQYAGYTVRKDIHRWFIPRKCDFPNETVYIMWTNIKGKTEPEIAWRPNHFVLLLPILRSLCNQEPAECDGYILGSPSLELNRLSSSEENKVTITHTDTDKGEVIEVVDFSFEQMSTIIDNVEDASIVNTCGEKLSVYNQSDRSKSPITEQMNISVKMDDIKCKPDEKLSEHIPEFEVVNLESLNISQLNICETKDRTAYTDTDRGQAIEVVDVTFQQSSTDIDNMEDEKSEDGKREKWSECNQNDGIKCPIKDQINNSIKMDENQCKPHEKLSETTLECEVVEDASSVNACREKSSDSECPLSVDSKCLITDQVNNSIIMDKNQCKPDEHPLEKTSELEGVIETTTFTANDNEHGIPSDNSASSTLQNM